MFFYWFASRQIWGGYSCALLETRLFIQLEGNINFTRGCLVRFVTGPLSQCRSLAVENCINNCVFFKRIWRVCPKNTYVYLESSHNIQVASANLWSFRPKKKTSNKVFALHLGLSITYILIKTKNLSESWKKINRIMSEKEAWNWKFSRGFPIRMTHKRCLPWKVHSKT